jgi:hypothetical protein
MGPQGMLRGYVHFSYVDEVRTSRETHLRSSTIHYGNSFTFYL